MKKKLYLFLAIGLLTVVSACSLYLDENDVRTIHTEDGYTNAQTITTDDGTTVTYQYNQNTIPITDEVEEYLVKIESDTILYFVDSTPDHLLPEEGMMMVCSFRDRFPHAFCHRCIERTEANGIYRCVFTPCSLKDAFDKLQATVEVSYEDYDFPEGSVVHDEAETDSILNDTGEEEEENEENYEDEDDTAGARWWHTTGPDRGWYDDYADGSTRGASDGKTRGWLDSWDFSLKKKSVTVTLPKVSLEVTVGSTTGVSASCQGSLTMGTKNVLKYDSVLGDMEVAYGIFGSLNLHFDVVATAGITLEAPVSIPIAGVKINFIVAGAEAGLTATPYMTVKKTISAEADINLGFNFAMSYENHYSGGSRAGDEESDDSNDQGTLSLKGDTDKKASLPVFQCKLKSDTKRQMNVEMGIDFRLGIGVDVAKTGVSAAVGCKVYSEVNMDFDEGKFESVEDFRKKNADFPTYAKPYVEGKLEFLAFGGKLGLEGKPMKCKVLKIPFFPVVDTKACKFYSTRHSPRTFMAQGGLKELGLLSAIYPYSPRMRVYTRLSKEAHDMGFEDEMVEEFKLNYDDGIYKFKKEEKSNDIQFNTDYTAQLVMQMGENYYVPLHDIPFNIQIPEMNILYCDDCYHHYGNFQKVVDGTQDDILPQYVTYRFCYTIDVKTQIRSARLIRKWGIHMNDPWCHSAEFVHSNDKKTDIKEPSVRFRWYTNRQQVRLNFYGFCYSGKEKDRTNFSDSQHSAYVDIEYNRGKEYESPTDETPDYDAELDNKRARRFSPTAGRVVGTFTDKLTGDYCEVICLDDDDDFEVYNGEE